MSLVPGSEIDPLVPERPRRRVRVAREAAAPLGKQAVGGASWLMVQAMIARVLSFVSQIFLAHLLLHEDFALVGLTSSVCIFTSLLQTSYLGDVLIQRQRHFTRWANSAFWLSMALTGVILLATFIVAPLAGWFFHSATISWLVLISGVGSALNGITAVWNAEQSIRFHFRLLATISTVVSIFATVLTIFFAWLRLGPYAIIAPVGISMVLSVLLYMRYSEFRPHGRIHFRRWRFLMGDSFMIGLVGFFSLVMMQADNFFLGIYRKNTMGTYVWAYSLSLQFVVLVTVALRGALLPTFSKIGEDQKRTEAAFLRSNNLVALVAMPICILAIPAMPAMVRYIFSSRWDDAVPLVQTFLPSMGFALIAGIATTTLQSRMRLKLLATAYAILAAIFVAVVWASAAFGDRQTVARGVSSMYLGTALVLALLATSPSTWGYKLKVLAASFVPFFIACGCAGLAWWCVSSAGLDSFGWQSGLLSLGIGYACYTVLAMALMRDRVKLTMEMFDLILKRFKKTPNVE